MVNTSKTFCSPVSFNGKMLNAADLIKRTEERDEKEQRRESERGDEPTFEQISLPRGARGERGMLSGTSATSHMCSLKDASEHADPTDGTCVRSSTPVHLNKLPMPC